MMMNGGLGQAIDIASAAAAVGSREQITQMMQQDIDREKQKLERRIEDLRARERQYVSEYERAVEQIRTYYQSLRGVLI
jgi:hypothetical protein